MLAVIYSGLAKVAPSAKWTLNNTKQNPLHYPMQEHCLPFNVARAYDEARGIDTPRIWTAQRDLDMWAGLQG